MIAQNSLFLVLVVIKINIINSDEYTYKNFIRFPVGPIEGPFMGLFLAISLPLELPDKNIFFSYNLEANYNLPQNQSEFSYPPLITKRSWNRKLVYDLLQFKLESHGFPGKSCLLRIICEASQFPFEHTGVLGDLFHIILTFVENIAKLTCNFLIAVLLLQIMETLQMSTKMRKSTAKRVGIVVDFRGYVQLVY